MLQIATLKKETLFTSKTMNYNAFQRFRDFFCNFIVKQFYYSELNSEKEEKD